MTSKYKTIVLCILDGWGIGQDQYQLNNAIKLANTPCWDFLLNNFPHTELSTSGKDVGLPEGQMGNSEVGHMTIGSGRVILQDLLRINKSISNNEFAKNLKFQELVNSHLNSNNVVHIMGLVSDGGVHSHLNHLLFISKFLGEQKIQVKLHLFLDGRDVGPKTATNFLTQVDELIYEFPSVSLGTISGRFFAMDRDTRWERTQAAYNAIALGKAEKFSTWQSYIQEQYDNNISDEFIPPASMNDYNGIKDGDSLFFVNFRSDRIRQLAKSLLFKNFDKFPKKDINLNHKIGMTRYSNELDKALVTLFPEQNIQNNLAQVLSDNHKKQMRIAETEKYAHVTFFFNSGIEEPYDGEKRILIPSPNVRTYDLTPEMSAADVTKTVIGSINSQEYDVIIVNYANCDMVGHSGKIEPAIKAVETIDKCLEELYLAISKTQGILIITADHGNVEHMFDIKDKSPHTSHTTNPVPLVLIASNLYGKNIELDKGNLSDIAPTILKLMNIEKPQEMTGKPLFVNN